MSWAEYAVCIRETVNAYKMLVQKQKDEAASGEIYLQIGSKIEKNLKKMAWELVKWIKIGYDRM